MVRKVLCCLALFLVCSVASGEISPPKLCFTAKIDEMRKNLFFDTLETQNFAKARKCRVVAVSVSRGSFPVVNGIMGSKFGWRKSPRRGFHAGVDIRAPFGTPIKNVLHGKICYVGVIGGYGKTVIVDSGRGLKVKYAHCSKINVSVGMEVNIGDVIARVGRTGFATGHHLHFEVLKNGQPVNPVSYLR